MRKVHFLHIALLLALVSCVPVQQAVQDTVNAIGRGADGATLAISDQEVTFNPAGVALSVVLYAGGEAVATTDDRCEAYRNGVVCFPGDLESESAFTITGATSANVSYYRSGSDVPRFFYVAAR